MVSAEELLYCDLSGLPPVNIDQDAFGRYIDVILPLISSQLSLRNNSFKKAYLAHKSFYDDIKRSDLSKLEKVFDVCFEGYFDACDDDQIQAEATADILALWFLLLLLTRTVPLIMKDKPASLLQIAKKDKRAKVLMEKGNLAFNTDADEVINEIHSNETREELSEMLYTLKRDPNLSDLADYYLALQFVWNLVDNGLSAGFNQRIGAEMLDAFSSVKNKFARRYLDFCYLALSGGSSQIVDDK